MNNRSRRLQRPQHRRINWFPIIVALIMIATLFKLGEQQMTISSIAEDRVKAEARLNQAKEENERLKEEQEQLSDPAYMEKLAREDLGMTKQGEMPFVYSKKQ